MGDSDVVVSSEVRKSLVEIDKLPLDQKGNAVSKLAEANPDAEMVINAFGDCFRKEKTFFSCYQEIKKKKAENDADPWGSFGLGRGPNPYSWSFYMAPSFGKDDFTVNDNEVNRTGIRLDIGGLARTPLSDHFMYFTPAVFFQYDRLTWSNGSSTGYRVGFGGEIILQYDPSRYLTKGAFSFLSPRVSVGGGVHVDSLDDNALAAFNLSMGVTVLRLGRLGFVVTEGMAFVNKRATDFITLFGLELGL